MKETKVYVVKHPEGAYEDYRELVKEVCEKIKNHFKTTCYVSIDEQNIYDVLDQIQKEFDNER